MKIVLMTILAAVLLAPAGGCRDDRNDETGKGERGERLDTTRGERPS